MLIRLAGERIRAYSIYMVILVIEDEVKLVGILTRALKSELYTVDTALDGEEGLKKAIKNDYGLIILDLMLPKKDGLTVCKELRAKQIHTPIIILTARTTEEDKVTGLDFGADDYLLKPFSLDELFARIRAVLRRRKISESDIKKIGTLTLDRKKHEVSRSGKIIQLTPKEYKLLDTLLTKQGEAVTRRDLIDQAWGPQFEETNNELNVHIRYLRKKIEGGKEKKLVYTVRGVGFALKE